MVQEIATAHSAVAVSSLSMGRHRRSPVVRDAAITRRTSHSSTIFAAAGQMAGASSASSASARCPSFIYGSSYTDSSSLASSFADSSSAGFLSSCSSTYNHTLSLGSRTSSFSTTDLSDSETPSTDLLSEANIDSCLSETADSVDNSEASDDDAEPDEEDDDGEPYNDDNGVRGASLRLPQHQWYAREIIGAGSGIGRGGGGYKKNTHKDEQELSPEEQALLADFQRQLDDFLQKRVTVHYSIIIIFLYFYLSIYLTFHRACCVVGAGGQVRRPRAGLGHGGRARGGSLSRRRRHGCDVILAPLLAGLGWTDAPYDAVFFALGGGL